MRWRIDGCRGFGPERMSCGVTMTVSVPPCLLTPFDPGSRPLCHGDGAVDVPLHDPGLCRSSKFAYPADWGPLRGAVGPRFPKALLAHRHDNLSFSCSVLT